MTTVVVSSAIANKYLNGGNAWTVLNWVLGLKKLGFHVNFLEQISRESCVDTAGAMTVFENCARMLRRSSLGPLWIDPHSVPQHDDAEAHPHDGEVAAHDFRKHVAK